MEFETFNQKTYNRNGMHSKGEMLKHFKEGMKICKEKIKTISKKNYQPIPWAHLCRLLEQPRSEKKDGLKIKL